ncbi:MULTISPECIES: hypothetical protein [unclassified Halomonas]|uniref:hypothetical protein n=1 Tax=unclassified Halomonas TaxID=2609666 RepID=UPI0007D96CBD|nr:MULTISPECIES: hypothetical protein [unclassified Halomonas]MBT2788395.1 hypothetical protein [Halomonas sp. ISL-106]MBT2797986.1 hypothetical protein [Halomonas sp. ISL-104]OAL60555.1 hypothetical protein A6R74_17670 [Halomonas sp. ALS9]
MTPFSILLIRVLAIYLALNPLLSVSPVLFSPGSEESINEWLPMLIAGVLIPMAAGVVLWFFARALANKIHGGSAAEPSVKISETGLVRAGSFLIGIYLFVHHIGTTISQWAWGGVIAYGSLPVIVISVGLIVGANSMGKLYKKIKYAGVDS